MNESENVTKLSNTIAAFDSLQTFSLRLSFSLSLVDTVLSEIHLTIRTTRQHTRKGQRPTSIHFELSYLLSLSFALPFCLLCVSIRFSLLASAQMPFVVCVVHRNVSQSDV